MKKKKRKLMSPQEIVSDILFGVGFRLYRSTCVNVDDTKLPPK